MDYSDLDSIVEGEGPEEDFAIDYDDLKKYAKRYGDIEKYKEVVGEKGDPGEEVEVKWSDLEEALDGEEPEGFLEKTYSKLASTTYAIKDRWHRIGDGLIGTLGAASTLGLGPLSPVVGFPVGYGMGTAVEKGFDKWVWSEDYQVQVNVEPEEPE